MRRWAVLLAMALVAPGLWATPAPRALARDNRPVSHAVYPPPEQRGLRFSHKTHSGRSCTVCHAGVERRVGTQDRGLPTEASCRPCHRESTRPPRAGAPGKGCRLCHPRYDGRRPPVRTTAPAANMRFSHRLHHQQGVGCGSCHRFGAGRRPLPAMATCLGCHRQRKVATRCVVCHLSNKDGRLRTRFASGKLRPTGTLVGDAHTRGFGRRHGTVARAKRQYCESCHAPRDCLRCHAGSLRPMTIHSGDYATRHAQDARRNEPRCDRCHRSQTFCLGCHQRLGVGMETPQSGFRPSTGRRFHPPGFVAVSRGAGHHSYSARRNIRTCSSCHRESTCVRCHGSRSLGRGGFSPHPPGFGSSAKCRALSARNQRVCVKCHRLGDRRIDCN